jgi:hypothetical protein
MIQAFERKKTVHAADRAAILIGYRHVCTAHFSRMFLTRAIAVTVILSYTHNVQITKNVNPFNPLKLTGYYMYHAL